MTSKGDELVEQLRREGGARALYEAAALVRAAGFVNADGYFRWLRDAAENVLEGKELDARRPREQPNGLSILLTGMTPEETTMNEDGSRVLRDVGWRPANADSKSTHELFQMTQGDWYCTGCQWAFAYRVGFSRAREVWVRSPQHKEPEPETEVPPKMYITEMRRRVDDNAEGDVMFGRDEMAHALDSYDQVVKELNALKSHATVAWLTDWIHARWTFEYDECSHGTYAGGPNNGEPYAMCERWAIALSEDMARR